jgi:hypothetical protein
VDSSFDYTLYPIVAVATHFRCRELPAKPAFLLGSVMIIKAKGGKIVWIIVRWIFIDVMNLNGLPAFIANATCVVLGKKNFGSNGLRYGYSHIK